jgi:hypothetical protein
MSDFVMAFKLALLANKKIGISFKTEEKAKVAFPSLIKDLHEFVNSRDYLMLELKEMQEKKEIIEGNKLIAYFMSAEKCEWYDDFNNNCKGLRIDGELYPENRLQYHSSWDWLMPVTEKIENIDFSVHIGNGFYCSISKFENDDNPFDGVYISSEVDPIYGKVDSKIKGVWLAVIEFIKWYNQNK